MANEKVTICHIPPGDPEKPRTIRVNEDAVQAHLDEHEGDYVGSCDVNSGLDARKYYPEKLVDDALVEEGLDGIQHEIDINDYRDIRDKYRDFNSLGKEVLEEILREYGYDYITDVLTLSEEEIRAFLGYIHIIKFLKGTKQGLEIVFRLIAEGYTIVEWWEFEDGGFDLMRLWGLSNDMAFRSNTLQASFISPTIEPDTYYLQILFDEEKTKPETFEKLQIFLRQYIYPLLVKLDFRTLFTEVLDREWSETLLDEENTTDIEFFKGILLWDDTSLISNTPQHHSNNLDTSCGMITIVDEPASTEEITQTVPDFGDTGVGVSNGSFQMVSTSIYHPEVSHIEKDVEIAPTIVSTYSWSPETSGHAETQITTIEVGDFPAWTEYIDVFIAPGQYSNTPSSLLSNTLGTSNGVITKTIQEINHPISTHFEDIISVVWVEDVLEPLVALISNQNNHHSNNLDIEYTQETILDQAAWSEFFYCVGGVGEYSNSFNLLSNFPVIGSHEEVIQVINNPEISHDECQCDSPPVAIPMFTWSLKQFGFGLLNSRDVHVKDDITFFDYYTWSTAFSDSFGNVLKSNYAPHTSNDVLFQTLTTLWSLRTEIIQEVIEEYDPETAVIEDGLLTIDDIADELRTKCNYMVSNRVEHHSNNLTLQDTQVTVIDQPAYSTSVNILIAPGQYSNSNLLQSNTLGVSNGTYSVGSVVTNFPEVSHVEDLYGLVPSEELTVSFCSNTFATEESLDDVRTLEHELVEIIRNYNLISNINSFHSNTATHTSYLDYEPYLDEIEIKSEEETDLEAISSEEDKLFIAENTNESVRTYIFISNSYCHSNNVDVVWSQQVVVDVPEHQISHQEFQVGGEYSNTFDLLSNTLGVSNPIVVLDTIFETIPEVNHLEDIYVLDTVLSPCFSNGILVWTPVEDVILETLAKVEEEEAFDLSMYGKTGNVLVSNRLQHNSNEPALETFTGDYSTKSDIIDANEEIASLASLDNFNLIEGEISSSEEREGVLDVLLLSNNTDRLSNAFGVTEAQFKASWYKFFETIEDQQDDQVDQYDITNTFIINSWSIPAERTDWEAYYLTLV